MEIEEVVELFKEQRITRKNVKYINTNCCCICDAMIEPHMEYIKTQENDEYDEKYICEECLEDVFEEME